MRVQIPAYTDRWMMGDRFGEVVKITKQRRATEPKGSHNVIREIAHVKLDISGKTLKFLFEDCTEV